MSDALVRRILLIEQPDGEVQHVRDFLLNDPGMPYEVDCLSGVEEAYRRLSEQSCDAVIIHVHAQDPPIAASIATLRRADPNISVLVYNGSNDEALAIAAIDAGAQDFLFQADLKPQTLKRAIDYAIGRKHESQMRAINETLSQLRALTTYSSQTSVTAGLMGVGPLRERAGGDFPDYVKTYGHLMQDYVRLMSRTGGGFGDLRQKMEYLVTQLGDHGAGPKDIIDLHSASLEASWQMQSGGKGNSLVVEGRLFALEMMGLLVNYYRVGNRRSWRVS